MPDIIEQLEEGKKIQQEEGIDVKSLRTKIDSEEIQIEKPKGKRGRKKKVVEPSENISKETETQDPLQQAEEMLNPQEEEPRKKSTKYPDFDFNNFYEKGQIIYFLRALPSMGYKDIIKARIRTIYPDLLIACEEKGMTHCIGVDQKDLIFNTKCDAVIASDKIKVEEVYNPDDGIENMEIKEEED